MSTDDGWKWWASIDGEYYEVGPCDTREGAIQSARTDFEGAAFTITRARQDPLRLAEWIDTERMLDRAEDQLADSDRLGEFDDDPPFFEATPQQKADLEKRVKRACDEWQAAHGLVFKVRTFSAMDNKERVPALVAD